MFWFLEICITIILAFCIKLFNDVKIEEKNKGENKSSFLTKQCTVGQIMIIAIIVLLNVSVIRVMI